MIQHTAQFLKRRLAALCVVALLVCMVPRPASAQFGIDIAAILAGLQAISQVLGQIQGVESQWTQFQQNTVYPQSLINQSKTAVLGWINSASQMNAVMNVGYSSAQLPSPQSLETALMSANANQIGNVSGLYQNVYGTVPPATNAPPYVRNAIDISDAEAQDAMKKAIQLDALATAGAECQSAIADANPASSAGIGTDSGSGSVGMASAGECIFAVGDGGVDAGTEYGDRQSDRQPESVNQGSQP